MAKEPKPKTDGGEDWVQVGKRPAAPAASPGDSPAMADEHKPFEGRQPTPPWKYSVYTGAAGLVLMLAVYGLPDLRSFDTPWDEAFPTAYALLPFPVFALVWGLIGIIGKQFRADAGRSFVGIVLAVIGFGAVFSGALMASEPAAQPSANEDRLQMSPQELQEWRSKKLRQ